LGLAPELPGSAAGPLLARQVWWVGTAISTAIALWLFLRNESIIAKVVAVALLALPHLIGAPAPVAFESKAPAELAAHFAAASLTTRRRCGSCPAWPPARCGCDSRNAPRSDGPRLMAAST